MAVRTISDAIVRAYQNYIHGYSGYRYSTQNHELLKYVTIPIDTDTFEIPLFAYDSFATAMMQDNLIPHTSNCIVATLEESGNTGCYKTLDANMKDCLLTHFKDKLIQLKIENGLYYYVTCGAVFNENLEPLMMMSWVLNRQHDVGENGENKYTYSFVQPILRLSKQCFAKKDSMQRYLTGKFLTTAINEAFNLRWLGRDWLRIFPELNDTRKLFTIAVVIDKLPFSIRGVETPSISTTNENLLQLAINHIEDIAV